MGPTLERLPEGLPLHAVSVLVTLLLMSNHPSIRVCEVMYK